MYCKKALENHSKKYNCCQSVICAFCDVLKIDEKTLFKIGEGFGAGMGNTTGPCGALSAVVAIAGLINSDGNLIAPASKKSTYDISAEIMDDFKKSVGEINCREIKTKSGTSCDECIIIATKIAENIINRRS